MVEAVPLTEPEIVPCLFVTGIGIEVSGTMVRFVAWSQMPTLGGEMQERRIVARLAMSNSDARDFQSVFRKVLAKGGH